MYQKHRDNIEAKKDGDETQAVNRMETNKKYEESNLNRLIAGDTSIKNARR